MHDVRVMQLITASINSKTRFSDDMAGILDERHGIHKA